MTLLLTVRKFVCLNLACPRGSTKERAKEFGVTQRTVERWRSSLEGKGSQKRSPLAKASKLGKLQMKLDASIVVGGDPAYSRRRTGIVVDVDKNLINHALGDEENQDEA